MLEFTYLSIFYFLEKKDPVIFTLTDCKLLKNGWVSCLSEYLLVYS